MKSNGNIQSFRPPDLAPASGRGVIASRRLSFGTAEAVPFRLVPRRAWCTLLKKTDRALREGPLMR